MQKLGFIGAGPVGTAFSVNLSQRGYQVTGVFDVNADAAERLAGDVDQCRVFNSAQALVDQTDMVFVTTPDDLIAPVTQDLTWRSGQAVVHCSGATTVQALESAREQAALVGAIHPCQTFAGRDQAIANLPAATFAIEAEEPLKAVLTEIARALDGDVVYLTSEDKALYHAAACIASCYAYTLADIATDLWRNFGKSKEEATRAYIPLLQGTVNNIDTVGFPGCPTGPIMRGDVRTIENHFVALKKYAPDILPLYKQLGLRTIPVGLAKGTLSQEKADALRRRLEVRCVMEHSPRPFTLNIPDGDIADLKVRLERTRFPDRVPGATWDFGTDVGYMRALTDYWRTHFDWRAQEAALNAFPQFKVDLHGIGLHYLHVPGAGPDPKPLLLLHGWPGSVFEFLDIIPRLTDPDRFGGDPVDAFSVVAPSLPGFGLSFAPDQERFGINRIVDCLADLMTDVLGYPKFLAQGGDWGAFGCSVLGIRHPDKVPGIHLNLLCVPPSADPPENATDEELRYAGEIDTWLKEETGYNLIQGTRPQTLAFGLADSPAGLAAWIVEKFHAWTDHDGDLEEAVDRDRMLANISLYWFTGAIGSSFWPYYDRLHGDWPITEGQTISVPTGYAAFPKEIRRPPRSIAQKLYTDIRHWTVMEKGGHFAALEQPAALAADVARFFRTLRDF